MKVYRRLQLCSYILSFILCFQLISLPVLADSEDYLEEAENRKNEPVQSNQVENWPQGPAIGAEGAILMDANTGAILYAKNIDEELYPASITKLMTCLVAVENCPLTDVITVNQSAIDANDYDGSNMGLSAGDQLTLEEILYGILINSANEGCNAVAEHVAGSMDEFVVMMNEKAAELGCENTHFVTTNGLHNEEHYTTAHDMALIGQAFFSHDILCKIACTSTYHIEETASHSEYYLHSKNRLYEGQDYFYEYLVGSKTGFTSHSRQTLVSCAERGGMKLICVILMEESPYQFEDTVNLFDYGFSNFSTTKLTSLENGYEIANSDFFDSSNSIFGSTSPIISMDRNASIILPNGIDFADVTSAISYEDLPENALATVEYTYQGMFLGQATVNLSEDASPNFVFSEIEPGQDAAASVSANTAEEHPVFINIYQVILLVVIIAFVVILLLILNSILKRHHFIRKRLAQIRKRRSNIPRRRPTAPRSTYYSKSSHSGGNPYLNQSRTSRKFTKRPKPLNRTMVNKNLFQSHSKSSRSEQPRKRNNINFKDFDL